MDLASKSYFVGERGRAECEDLVLQSGAGSFLVRVSPRSGYVITVAKPAGACGNYVIENVGGMYRISGEQEAHPSLAALIDATVQKGLHGVPPLRPVVLPTPGRGGGRGQSATLNPRPGGGGSNGGAPMQAWGAAGGTKAATMDSRPAPPSSARPSGSGALPASMPPPGAATGPGGFHVGQVVTFKSGHGFAKEGTITGFNKDKRGRDLVGFRANDEKKPRWVNPAELAPSTPLVSNPVFDSPSTQQSPLTTQQPTATFKGPPRSGNNAVYGGSMRFTKSTYIKGCGEYAQVLPSNYAISSATGMSFGGKYHTPECLCCGDKETYIDFTDHEGRFRLHYTTGGCNKTCCWKSYSKIRVPVNGQWATAAKFKKPKGAKKCGILPKDFGAMAAGVAASCFSYGTVQRVLLSMQTADGTEVFTRRQQEEKCPICLFLLCLPLVCFPCAPFGLNKICKMICSCPAEREPCCPADEPCCPICCKTRDRPINVRYAYYGPRKNMKSTIAEVEEPLGYYTFNLVFKQWYWLCLRTTTLPSNYVVEVGMPNRPEGYTPLEGKILLANAISTDLFRWLPFSRPPKR